MDESDAEKMDADKKSPKVDIDKLVDELYDAMDGFGTDEDPIADALKQIKDAEQWGPITILLQKRAQRRLTN